MLRRRNLIIAAQASEQACCHILLPRSRKARLESPLRSNYKTSFVARWAREAIVGSWHKSGASLGKTGQSKITFSMPHLQHGSPWKITVDVQIFTSGRANGSPHTSTHQCSLMFRNKQLNPTHQRKTMSCSKWNLAKERPNWALVPVLRFSVLPPLLTHCVAECLCVSESNDGMSG